MPPDWYIGPVEAGIARDGRYEKSEDKRSFLSYNISSEFSQFYYVTYVCRQQWTIVNEMPIYLIFFFLNKQKEVI